MVSKWSQTRLAKERQVAGGSRVRLVAAEKEWMDALGNKSWSNKNGAFLSQEETFARGEAKEAQSNKLTQSDGGGS